MSELADLNKHQKKAVEAISGPLLVLAGAGSGKTRVITQKIAYLINTCGYRAPNITAVTFTNKAAREMKARATALLDSKRSKGLTVSTFHSLGLSIIRKERAAFGLKSGFSIFDDQDSRSLISELQQRYGFDKDDIEFNLATISRWKSQLISPIQAQSHGSDDKQLKIAQLYDDYCRCMVAYNSVDFDDLIRLPVELLTADPTTRQRWQTQLHYLLVDEYQDTNSSQYELIKLLVGTRQCFTVVGDDDQSINAWRGAKPENINQLGQDFPKLEVIKLEQNYRSTCTILHAANTVIAKNPHMFEKRLWSDLGNGEPIRVISADNEDKEATRVVSEILDQKIRLKRPFGDFAILYRGNHQARLIELKLQAMQVPYKLSGGTSFFSRTEIKDIMAYLRIIMNPDDDNAFLRIINVPKREIGSNTIERLGKYAHQRNQSMFQCAQEMGLREFLPQKSTDRLGRFCHWIQSLQRELDDNTKTDALWTMLDNMDYAGWVQSLSSTTKAAEKRMQNVRILFQSIQDTMQQIGDHENPLQAAVSKLILRDILERQEQEESDTSEVQLMTLHASKGLEFPYVYIVGTEENILPHRTSIEENAIEEERRLFYVGITRAQRELTISLAKQRKQYGEKIDCAPSRFLEELPSDYVQWTGHQSLSIEENQARGQEHLAALRAMLD